MRAFVAVVRGIVLLALPVLFVLSLVLVARSPIEAEMRVAQKIFYFHVPLAIASFLAFGLNCVASIGVLATGRPAWDRLARAAAEPGLLFLTLVLITGSIWARPIWNTWWTWEPRLTTALLLWLLYVAYFVLRSRMDDPVRRAKAAAVLGILGFANVPVVYSSIFWLERRYRLHPVVFTARGASMEPSMLHAFAVSFAFLVLLLVALVWLRYRLLRAEDRIRELSETAPAHPGAVLGLMAPLALLLQGEGGAAVTEAWRTLPGAGEEALARNIGYVVAAYGAIWLGLLLYVWFLARRLAAMERKLGEGARDGEAGSR